MTRTESAQALQAAIQAAKAAGGLMRPNLHRPKKVNSTDTHDIKLDLDVRCQRLITRLLAKELPAIPVLGEEGWDDSTATAPARWVVDPIDGTVNFALGIPHAAVSIALQTRVGSGFRTEVGVIYDPFMDELWTAVRGGKARRNGKVIRVSDKRRLADAVVSVGFPGGRAGLEVMVHDLGILTHRVMKLRLMGSAALALAYVADGRFDAFIETGLKLWDIAAGGLIVECAGGEFWSQPKEEPFHFSINANNGHLRKPLEKAIQTGR
jgi:myo-inositol-1(or 4)-monophosphatase